MGFNAVDRIFNKNCPIFSRQSSMGRARVRVGVKVVGSKVVFWAVLMFSVS